MPGLASHWYLILIVLVIVLIIWGPGKLPDVGAGMGRAIREFRKASSETRDTVMNAGTDTTTTTTTSHTPEPPAAAPAPPPPVGAPAPPPAPEQYPSPIPPQTPVSR